MKNIFVKFFRKFFPEKKDKFFINRQMSSYEERYQSIELGSRKIAYLQKGEGKKNILFLHGMTEDALNWFYAMEYLYIRSSGYSMWAIDLPYWGKTEVPVSEKLDIQNYVNLIKDFLDHLEIKKVILVGHSLGGQTAVNFASQYPDYVEKIILTSTAGIRRVGILTSGLFKAMPIPGHIMHQTGILDWFKIMSSGTLLKDKHYFYKAMYDMVMIRRNSITDFFTERNFQRLSSQGLTRVTIIKDAMNTMMDSHYYIEEKLSKLQCPVCLIWGEKDKLVPVRIGFQCYDLIPHSNKRIYVFKKTGHYSVLERPRDFSESLFKFLESVD